jgi:hypothetical protein
MVILMEYSALRKILESSQQGPATVVSCNPREIHISSHCESSHAKAFAMFSDYLCGEELLTSGILTGQYSERTFNIVDNENLLSLFYFILQMEMTHDNGDNLVFHHPSMYIFI